MKNRRARCNAFLSLVVFCVFFLPFRLKADDWPAVSPDELALKDNPASPGADAMILYRDNVVDATKVREGGDSEREYYRIKIFTQAGIQQADVKIPYVKENMNVTDVAGRTIHPDGTIVKFEGKVLESTITERNGFKYLAKTFTLPDVQPGSIIEYRYSRQGQPGYLHDLEWQVSEDIFTREAHFTMKPYDYETGYAVFFRLYNLPADALPKQEGLLNIYTMVVHNVPAIVDEPLMPGKRMLESRVQFFYKEAVGTDAPDKFWAKQAKKWDGEFEHFIDKKDVLKTEVSKTVQASDAPEVKLQKLYARAQQIRNLNDEDAKTEQELKSENIKPNSNVADVLSRGYGYGHEINFLFAGLVRAAGFQAEEVRIAPVTGQMFNPGGEDIRQLDDDIVWVSADSKEYYADPAARYYPFKLLPWYEQGAGGMRLDKPSPLINTSSSTEADAGLARNAEVSLGADGTTTGKISIDFRGQDAAILREENRKEDETGRKKNVADQIHSWLPSGAKFDIVSAGPWDDNTQPLHVEGTLSVSGIGAPAGSRILLPIEIFATRYSDVFAAEKRVNAIDFRYAYEDIDDIKLIPPPGYSVASLPQPGKFNVGAVTYSIEAAKDGNGLEVKRDFAMKGTAFEAKYYGSVRKVFGNAKADDNAQAMFAKSN